MKKNNIHCKIELVKNSSDGQMMIKAHLNLQAPNIRFDEQTITWTPTFEEQNFLIDAFKLIQNQKKQPLVMFTKRNNESMKTNKKNIESIESINQTIDNLELSENKNKKTNQKPVQISSIEKIIKQNAKQN